MVLRDRIEALTREKHLARVKPFFFDHIDIRTSPTDWFLTRENLCYYSARFRCVFELEKGFLTNFASLPPPARVLFNHNGSSKLPAAFHDKLYTDCGVASVYAIPCLHALIHCCQEYEAFRTIRDAGEQENNLVTLTLSRNQCDRLFLEALGAESVGRFTQLAFYHMVNLFGDSHFCDCEKEAA